jgi:hypothetical protein
MAGGEVVLLVVLNTGQRLGGGGAGSAQVYVVLH